MREYEGRGSDIGSSTPLIDAGKTKGAAAFMRAFKEMK